MELCESHESGSQQALKLLDDDTHSLEATASARELLDSAAIALGEARGEIQHYIDTVENQSGAFERSTKAPGKYL